MSLAVLLVKPPPCKRGLNALAMSFCLSVSLFVCRQKLSNLELWSLLTTNRKRRPIGSPTLAFQRTHSWRMTLSDSKPRPVLQRWRQGLPCRPMDRYTCCKITNIFKHYNTYMYNVFSKTSPFVFWISDSMAETECLF